MEYHQFATSVRRMRRKNLLKKEKLEQRL